MNDNENSNYLSLSKLNCTIDDFTPDILNLVKAKKKGDGDLIVKVEGTSKPVHVRLTNKTPEIIKISKGDELIVTTSGGTENTSRIEIKRLQKGDYRVDARIEM